MKIELTSREISQLIKYVKDHREKKKPGSDKSQFLSKLHEKLVASLADGIRQKKRPTIAVVDIRSTPPPRPTSPPSTIVTRPGLFKKCKNCHSSISKSGFLGIFGTRYCDNSKCPNSKPYY